MLILPALFLSQAMSVPAFHSSTHQYRMGEKTFSESIRIDLPQSWDAAGHARLNQIIGPVFPPFSSITHVKKSGAHTIYNARYTVKDFGLRLQSSAGTKAHLIIAGDSNIFGEGCNDDQTLFWFLEKAQSGYHLYNFGHRGGGPHNTLSLLQHLPYSSLIKEKPGMFLYVFYPGHMIERVIGGKNYVAWDKGQSPWYSLDDHDHLQLNGSFNQRFLTKIFQVIARTEWLNRLLPTLPRLNDSHIHLTAKIFQEMQKNYHQHFPEGVFVVLIAPDETGSEWSEKIQQELNRLQVSSKVLSPLKDPSLRFEDGHNNPRGQAQLAAELLKIFSLH